MLENINVTEVTKNVTKVTKNVSKHLSSVQRLLIPKHDQEVLSLYIVLNASKHDFKFEKLFFI